MSIEIKLNHIPAINFSMQQNHVPVIRYVTVKNNGHEDLDDLDILITFDPECAAPVTLHIDRLKGEKSLRLEDIPVKLSTSFLSNLPKPPTTYPYSPSTNGADYLCIRRC